MCTYIRKGFLVLFLMLLSSAPASAEEASHLSMGALGDSITRAFNSGGVIDTPRNSWSTGYGLRITSHKKLLEKFSDQRVYGYNVARSGATTSDLDRQVAKLLSKANHVDYVTLLIGANDVCGWSQDYDEESLRFQNRVRAAIELLIANNQKIKILISSIPDMYQLWEIGTELGCQANWNLTGFCSALLGKDVTTAQRFQFVEKWRTANDYLEDVAQEFPDNVRFAENTQYVQFEAEQVSALDCFHPSVKGQNMLSESLWNEGWYQ
jgi:lysophospholipase L1-like esterase